MNPVAIGNFSSVQKPRLFFVVARVLSGPWLVNKSICKKSSLGNIANLFVRVQTRPQGKQEAPGVDVGMS